MISEFAAPRAISPHPGSITEPPEAFRNSQSRLANPAPEEPGPTTM
jgi:hypothetical protein